jgi:hypothetical protein
MKGIHFTRISLITAAILAIPLVAMFFTNEVNWTAFDFVFAGVLLFSAGLAYELVTSKAKAGAYRIAVGIACLTTLVLMWANAAVGIIGDGPVNAWYAAVPLVLIAGSTLVLLRSDGMMYVLYAAAATMMLIPTIAFFTFHPPFDSGAVGVFMINAFFAGLYILAALFFRSAARARSGE